MMDKDLTIDMIAESMDSFAYPTQMTQEKNKYNKELDEGGLSLDMAANHWNEMRVDQKQSDTKALGWDESAAELMWNELTPEQQGVYRAHYNSEN